MRWRGGWGGDGAVLREGAWMKRKAQVVVGLAAAFAAGLAVGRALPGSQRRGSEQGPTIVDLGRERLGAAQVRAALAAQRAAIRTAGGDAPRRIVEELARTRLLALRAIEQGYDRDPEISRRYSEQLAAVYLEKEAGALPAPTDADVRTFFDAHRAELAEPERARVAVVSFVAASPDERGAKRAKAAAALREALAHRNEHYAFGELARARSEDPRTAARNGELGELTREELSAAAGSELAAAAFSMASPGVHEAVVESASGYHVLKVLAREPGHEPAFDAVREALRERLASERRAARRKAAMEEAWSRAEVRIDDGAVRQLVAELQPGRR